MAARKVVAFIGYVPIPMKLEKAVDDETSATHTVCLGGKNGEPAHDPTRVRNHTICPHRERDETSTYGYQDRAAEVGDKLVVVSAEDLKAAAGEPIKKMELAFHPREKVYAATVTGGMVNNLMPDAGGEKAYALLRETLVAHPGLVAVTVWAPVTKNALWVLEVVDQRLVATSRAWPEMVRPTVQVTDPADITDIERMSFTQLVEAVVADFDLLQYENGAKKGVNAFIAAQDGVTVRQGSGKNDQVAVGNLLDAINASMEAAKPALPVQKGKPTAKKAAAPRKRVVPKEKVA